MAPHRPWLKKECSRFLRVLTCIHMAIQQRHRNQDRLHFGSLLNPIRMTAGATSQASLSQLQLFLFTMLVFSILIYHLASDGILCGLSSSLLLLLGVKSGGAALSRFVAEAKSKSGLPEALQSFIAGLGWFSGQKPASHASGDEALPSSSAPGRDKTQQERFELRSLLFSGNHFDPFKLQKLLFGIAIAIYVMVQGFWNELGSIAIPEGILFLAGLSEAAYAGSKGFSSRIDILEQRIKSMMQLADKYKESTGHEESREHYRELYERTAAQAAGDFRRLFGLEVIQSALKLPPELTSGAIPVPVNNSAPVTT